MPCPRQQGLSAAEREEIRRVMADEKITVLEDDELVRQRGEDAVC